MNDAFSWYRLDDSAIIYQMILTPKSQSLFRLGAELSEPVNPHVLRQAVEQAFLRHPYFRCELKRGFFRPYLDENKQPFPVEQDDGLLLNLLDFRKNNRFLLRVTYFGTRVFIDFFHGLCDATGGMEFFKTMLFYYAEEIGKPVAGDGVRTLSAPAHPEETEDAFRKYFIKPDFQRGVTHMAGGRAYQIPGKRFSEGGCGLVQVTVPTEKLLSLSHSYDCTVSVFLTALMFLSVLKMHITGSYKGNLTAFVPVNLRRSHPSQTLKNFTVFAKIVLPRDVRAELPELIGIIKEKLSEQLENAELELKLGFSTLMATMPFLKFMPLFIKTFISKIGRKFAIPKQTFILSNLGVIRFPTDSVVRSFLFNLNCNAKTPDNVGVISFNDKTVVSFTRKIVSTEIERAFCVELSHLLDGDVEVISNFREECDAL